MAVGDTGEKPAADRPPSEKVSSQPLPQLRPWSAFAFRDYRVLWLSSVASLVTMQLRLLVAGVWLYEQTGSGLQLGLLGIVQLAVQLP
ncbi:MAG: hypothetical protein IIB17_00190, partial [Chloroflexi bacterium]|nr:hypothetical protein [Chloroflexota bacterium]